MLSWEDPEQFLHDRVRETSDLDALAGYDDRPEATRFVMTLKEGFKAIFRRHRCAHVQIGRAYPWKDTLKPRTLALITAIKDATDPDGLINRGSLGFGSGED